MIKIYEQTVLAAVEMSYTLLRMRFERTGRSSKYKRPRVGWYSSIEPWNMIEN